MNMLMTRPVTAPPSSARRRADLGQHGNEDDRQRDRDDGRGHHADDQEHRTRLWAWNMFSKPKAAKLLGEHALSATMGNSSPTCAW